MESFHRHSPKEEGPSLPSRDLAAGPVARFDSRYFFDPDSRALVRNGSSEVTVILPQPDCDRFHSAFHHVETRCKHFSDKVWDLDEGDSPYKIGVDFGTPFFRGRLSIQPWPEGDDSLGRQYELFNQKISDEAYASSLFLVTLVLDKSSHHLIAGDLFKTLRVKTDFPEGSVLDEFYRKPEDRVA